MSMNLYRETAEIYDIFSGKRISAGGDRDAVVQASERTFERNPDVMDATAWYHDSAIRDCEGW